MFSPTKQSVQRDTEPLELAFNPPPVDCNNTKDAECFLEIKMFFYCNEKININKIKTLL